MVACRFGQQPDVEKERPLDENIQPQVQIKFVLNYCNQAFKSVVVE